MTPIWLPVINDFFLLNFAHEDSAWGRSDFNLAVCSVHIYMYIAEVSAEKNITRGNYIYTINIQMLTSVGICFKSVFS